MDDESDDLDDEDCIVHENMTVTHSHPNHHNIFPPGGNTAGGNLLGNHGDDDDDEHLKSSRRICDDISGMFQSATRLCDDDHQSSDGDDDHLIRAIAVTVKIVVL